MRLPAHILFPAVGIAALMAVAACGASLDEAGGSSGSGLDGAGGGFSSSNTQGPGGSGVTVGGGGGRNPSAFDYSHLCGDGCIPETARASAVPCELDGGGGAGTGGAGTSTATTGVGGSGSGTGGAGGSGGDGTTTGAGGGAGGGTVIGPDCKLSIESNGAVAGMCAEVGEGADRAACITSAQCAPGYGCVGFPGECRAYCCGNVDACPAGTYCAPRKPSDGELVGVTNTDVEIPVCDLADGCSLLTPNACEAGKTCSIVRTDGTTSCIDEGIGAAGEPCPCKADHVCNYALNKCLQLCRTDGEDDCPPDMACQGHGSEYPDGIGICVSTD